MCGAADVSVLVLGNTAWTAPQLPAVFWRAWTVSKPALGVARQTTVASPEPFGLIAIAGSMIAVAAGALNRASFTQVELPAAFDQSSRQPVPLTQGAVVVVIFEKATTASPAGSTARLGPLLPGTGPSSCGATQVPPGGRLVPWANLGGPLSTVITMTAPPWASAWMLGVGRAFARTGDSVTVCGATHAAPSADAGMSSPATSARVIQSGGRAPRRTVRVREGKRILAASIGPRGEKRDPRTGDARHTPAARRALACAASSSSSPGSGSSCISRASSIS